MPRISPVSWKTLECVFLKVGFTFERQKESHRSYVKPGILRTVFIPAYNEVDIEIIMSNLRTVGLDRGIYFKFLSEC